MGRTAPFMVLIKCNDLAFCSGSNFVREGEEAPYAKVPTAEVLMSVRHYTLEKNSTNIFTFDSSCDNLEGSLVA